MSAGKKGWAWLAAGTAAAVVSVVPSPATAHDTEAVPGAEPAAAEVAALGYDHAAEHAAMPGPLARREAGPTTSPANSVAGGAPEDVGRWVEGPSGVIDLPNFAIHAILMPTGKVLFWGYPPTPENSGHVNRGEAAIWDPSLGTGPASIRELDPPLIDPDGPAGPQGQVPATIYCSGQSLLPNGDVLVTGGNVVWADQYPDDDYTDAAGLNTIYTFDPFAEKWVRQHDMTDGRWYPTQVLLGDGRTVIIGGRTSDKSPPGTGARSSNRAEIFTPASANGGVGKIETAGQGDEFLTSLYPHLFTLPNDEVLMFGPGFWETSRFDFPLGQPGTRTYGPNAPDGISRYGGTAVLEPGTYGGSWKALQFGGWDDSKPVDAEGKLLSTNTSTEIDAKTLHTSRGERTPIARAYSNTVLLPDRSMVNVGGAAGRDGKYGNYFTDDDPKLKQVEIYDPGTDTWRLGPSQREHRTYHSVALLLPDGRVWSAGDDYHEEEPSQIGAGYRSSTKDTAEIYEPPYLFRKGPRPKIENVATEIGYGDEFGVATKQGRGKTAVLMAPGAPTHAVDMQQRMVVLKKVGKVPGEGLNMKTPRAPGAAPPGYYMLFVMGSNGKPSVAKWVKLSNRADKRNSKVLKSARNGGRKR